MMRVLSTVALVLLWVLHTAATRPGGRGQLAVDQSFLAQTFQLRDGDFVQLARRRAIARSLSTADKREIATLGVIQVAVPPVFYMNQLREIVKLKSESDAVLQIGVFSSPARVEDVSGLTFENDDLDHLRRCRPGDCKIQLSADALDRVQHDLPPDRATANAAVEQRMRAVLVDLVNQYRRIGDRALMTYIDGAMPVSVSSEFRRMISSPPRVLARFPSLHRHLVEFPHTSTPSVADTIYWSKEKIGPVVIVSVTHLAIGDATPAEGFAAASKQLYGSHYFDASLGLTVALGTARAPSMTLVYVNRSQVDALGGLWSGVKRAVVGARARSAMASSLAEARDLVEVRFRSRSPLVSLLNGRDSQF
jgi:hypothetical protein